MDLWQLRYFVATVDAGNFGRAAERLNVSQPSITRAIQSLEAEIGAPLLLRGRGGFGLTEAGLRFVADARRLLADADRSVELARRSARGEAGCITIGFEASVVVSAIPILAARYRLQQPNIVLELVEMPTHAQVVALLDGKIDLGVVAPIAPDARIASRQFAREGLHAAVARAHALAGNAGIALERLAAEPWVTSSHGGHCGLHQRIQHRLGREVTVAADVNDTQLALDFVAAGIGVAVVPDSVAARGHKGVTFMKLLPAEEVVYGLISRADTARPAVVRLLAFFEDFLNQAPTES